MSSCSVQITTVADGSTRKALLRGDRNGDVVKYRQDGDFVELDFSNGFRMKREGELGLELVLPAQGEGRLFLRGERETVFKVILHRCDVVREPSKISCLIRYEVDYGTMLQKFTVHTVILSEEK